MSHQGPPSAAAMPRPASTCVVTHMTGAYGMRRAARQRGVGESAYTMEGQVRRRRGDDGHSELGGGTLLKKIIFVMLLILVGVGAFFAWKMLKGDGGCCGWGGDTHRSSYTPPAEETPETPAA